MGKKKAVEYLPLSDFDLEDVVSCSLCRTVFVQVEGDEACPRCGGEGLNPGPEKEDEDEDYGPWPGDEEK